MMRVRVDAQDWETSYDRGSPQSPAVRGGAVTVTFAVSGRDVQRCTGVGVNQ